MTAAPSFSLAANEIETRVRREFVGMRGIVFFDERRVFDLCDETFGEGQIGLWTKSDAITYFDDLTLRIAR